MAISQFKLLHDRRFGPLFITQFLGAFHDNLFKNALVVLLLFGTAAQGRDHAELLVTLAAGLFILPFILFSALGGQLSDKYPKDKVIRVIKAAEIAIAALGATALMSGSITLSFAALFALGTHSAFFSPSKYSILPEHLKPEELIAANALLNTGTFLAILVGTICGTLLAVMPSGTTILSAVLLACAAIGWVASRSIPVAPAVAPNLKPNLNVFAESMTILRYVTRHSRTIFLSVLGTSWFYFLGGMFMAQMPNYVRETLGADEYVLMFFLVVFSIGIAIGGLLNNRLLKSRVEATYVPLAALGMSIFSLDLYFASAHITRSAELTGLATFLSSPAHWRIIADIVLLSMCGGLYVVPLNAITQHFTPEDHRARVQAGNSIYNALFIVASSALSAALIYAGFSIRGLFLAFALANTAVAFYICRLLPDYLLKSALQILFKALYKVEVRGLENIDKEGKRAVIVGNHVSLLDPALLAAFLPGRPMFAVNSHVANWWFVKPFLRLVDAFPLDPTNPFSMKALIRKVEEDRHVVIFPEGRLTHTGSLMKIYDGPGMIADKTGATILPIRLDGVQHTPFTRLKGKVPLKSFPKITVTILEPRTFHIDENLKGRARRSAAARQLYDLMEEMMFLTGDRNQTLWQALLKAGTVNGADAAIVEDIAFEPLKFKRLIQGSLILGRRFAGLTQKNENVGILLPNSVGAVIAFFGLQAFGRVPAMLNFSAGAKAMSSACTTAQVKTVLTSRRFIEVAKLDQVIAQLAHGVKIVYLEDIKQSISWRDKLFALTVDPALLHEKQAVNPDSPALVLFTSGSEGEPKGVVLSHSNLMTNIVQLSSRVDFNRQDILFNCLPMFHSFGMTGGTLLPILSGVKTFLYPSPLHYRIVPEIIYATNATIMFGTDTFLQGYARMANPYDFFAMRYIFAGAEKVKDETRRIYMEKFGVQVLEGYGATETSPAISVNSRMHKKSGTVGRFLSGIEYRLDEVPGVVEGRRLYIHGPNVMLGYYKSDLPGVIQAPEGGWHDTGDIVSVDEEGYLKILGRAKRFAKIAGEMVSLTQVEAMAAAVWPNAQHAVISQPDPRKGEQLILVTTQPDASREPLASFATQNGITALALPATILPVEKVPVLGTGKTDYQGVTALVGEMLKKAA